MHCFFAPSNTRYYREDKVGDKASEILDALVKQKIFVRDGAAWNLPKHLRISYGLEEENQAFFAALNQLL